MTHAHHHQYQRLRFSKCAGCFVFCLFQWKNNPAFWKQNAHSNKKQSDSKLCWTFCALAFTSWRPLFGSLFSFVRPSYLNLSMYYSFSSTLWTWVIFFSLPSPSLLLLLLLLCSTLSGPTPPPPLLIWAWAWTPKLLTRTFKKNELQFFFVMATNQNHATGCLPPPTSPTSLVGYYVLL